MIPFAPDLMFLAPERFALLAVPMLFAVLYFLRQRRRRAYVLRFTDPELIDRALRDAAEAASATILHSHFHHFGPDGGVSGVLVLAESHISIHTWPERDFAAIDIFMCGACDPHRSIPVLQQAFSPERIDLDEQRRGRVY